MVFFTITLCAYYTVTLIKVLGFQYGDLGSWFLGGVGMNIHAGDERVPEHLGCWGRVAAGARCPFIRETCPAL